MSDVSFIQKHHLYETAFTRSCKLDFKTLITFLLKHRKGATQTELDHFFAGHLDSDFARRHITKSACIQARKHLSHEAFIELNKCFIDALYASKSKTLKTLAWASSLCCLWQPTTITQRGCTTRKVRLPIRRSKHHQEIENLSGKSVQVVLQDFYAKILASNLTAALVVSGHQYVEKDQSKDQPTYQINMAQAFAKMKQYQVKLWKLTGSSLACYLRELVRLISQFKEQVRPDRRFPRKVSKFNKRRYWMHYKCTL
jgi:hypothetical protein